MPHTAQDPPGTTFLLLTPCFALPKQTSTIISRIACETIERKEKCSTAFDCLQIDSLLSSASKCLHLFCRMFILLDDRGMDECWYDG